MNLRKKVALSVVALAGLALLVAALWPSPVPVSAVVAERSDFQEYVEEEGRTTLRDPYMVSAPIAGYLRRVTLEVGDRVEAGDVVFRLEPVPAPALDLRTLEQAAEAVGAAQARLEAAEVETVMRESEARYAEREFERYESLYEQSMISASELDRARNERDRSRSAVQAARNAREAARFELRNARAVLEVGEGRRVSDDRPVLEIQAPVDGAVLRRLRWNEGMVQAGEPVLDIGDLSQLEVTVDLLSMDAVRVAEDMNVVLTRWGGGRDLDARVRRIEPAGFTRISALGVEEQRVPVRIVLDTPREEWGQLGEGYRVEARFILWEGEDVLRIPTSALFRDEDAWNVFVVENGRAVVRPVNPGRRSGLWTQVLSGLESGEVVVTHPGDRVADGVRIRPDVREYR